MKRVEDEVRSVNLQVINQAVKLWPNIFVITSITRVSKHVTDFGLVEPHGQTTDYQAGFPPKVRMAAVFAEIFFREAKFAKYYENFICMIYLLSPLLDILADSVIMQEALRSRILVKA